MTTQNEIHPNIYKRIYSLHGVSVQSPESVFNMSAYIRSHSTMPSSVNPAAKVMHKLGELQLAVAEMAGAAEHHGSTTSDKPAKPKRTKEEKEAHKLMLEERTSKRKAFQEKWLSENKSSEEIAAFNNDLVALQDKQKAAKKAATESGKPGKEKEADKTKAHSDYVKSIRALLKKNGVPDMPAGTTIEVGSAMEDEMDHDLWMERPQGYPMRDSLRYL